ncbi:MAG: winged helix-turn-helix domain-containing protein [Sinimarinibacterium sp.]
MLSGASATESRRWIFGRAVVDERTLELLVDGEEVEIERKPFEVLRFLLQHAGEVVTKDELLEGVWPGRFLSESVLAKAISRLREVLHDPDQELIKTVHGYGYRLVAQVRVEVQHAPEVAHFDFKAGDHPPARPLWSLVRRLGSGGHGEAWLGRHDKTHEQRVFKFAIDEPSLGALKREITLFRFLNDSLGEHARIVTLMDWNLEQPPCFIESEYIAGGSMIEWAERSGGLAKIPLATRLDLAAQIAEALAAVHAVGVLHKDLKPSNVLIASLPPLAGGDTEGGVSRAAPNIRLADFGSGGVLDAKQLEALGITRLGFTRTIAALGATTGGTPLYLAPELLAGQPPTVKADIYALGVMLYQLVVGEFRKAMASGWEHEVADEVLRECIADAARGDAACRLADAGALALRLRTLDEERERRRHEREAKEKAEALERALAQAKASQAVAEFLSKDMFAVVGSKPLRDLTVRELLDAASEKLADRFDEMPLAAAQVHAALGHAFWNMEALAEADKHLGRALDLYEQQGAMSGDVLSVAAVLVSVQFMLGKLAASLPRHDAIRALAETVIGAANSDVAKFRVNVARARMEMGDWLPAVAEFRELVQTLTADTGADPLLLCTVRRMLGYALLRLGEFESAEQAMRQALDLILRIEGAPALAIAHAHFDRGRVLIEQEEFPESDRELSEALRLFLEWSPSDQSGVVLAVTATIGFLRLRQGRTDEAIALIENPVSTLARLAGPSVDQQSEIRSWLALAYQASGRLDVALSEMSSALASSERAHGKAHPLTQHLCIARADILRERGEATEAQAVLSQVDRAALERLAPDHPYLAELHRVEGLIAGAEGRHEAARGSLERALLIFKSRYGAQHGFTRRARLEVGRQP